MLFRLATRVSAGQRMCARSGETRDTPSRTRAHQSICQSILPINLPINVAVRVLCDRARRCIPRTRASVTRRGGMNTHVMYGREIHHIAVRLR